jgi:hypothetical protein
MPELQDTHREDRISNLREWHYFVMFAACLTLAQLDSRFHFCVRTSKPFFFGMYGTHAAEARARNDALATGPARHKASTVSEKWKRPTNMGLCVRCLHVFDTQACAVFLSDSVQSLRQRHFHANNIAVALLDAVASTALLHLAAHDTEGE